MNFNGSSKINLDSGLIAGSFDHDRRHVVVYFSAETGRASFVQSVCGRKHHELFKTLTPLQ
jgi:hypothetical protein